MTARGIDDPGPSKGLVCAIVLAGGRSSRFGSSKLDADLAGRSVLDRTLTAVAEVAEEVIVVGRAGSDAATQFLEDPAPFEGPLAGLAVGLDAARSDLALVVGGDMPLLHPAVLQALLERLGSSGAEAAVLVVNGEVRPLPMAIRIEPGRAAARVALAGTRRALRDLVANLRVAEIAEADWRAVDPVGDTVLDIDREPDLEEARRRLAARSSSASRD